MLSTKGYKVVFLLVVAIALISISSVQAYADCDQCGVCQDFYKPVCGADGVTYGNACQLGCEKNCRQPGLKVAHDGACGNPVVYPPH